MYKVFLADDEAWITIGLKKLIEKTELPFQVVGEAMNGIVAVEAVEEKRPDLLITDIRMPGYNGLELMEQMKKKNLDTQVIFLSGYAEFEYARRAVQLGAFDYLVKPVKYEGLKKVLDTFMETFERDGAIREENLQEEVNLSTVQAVISELQKNYMKDITLTSISEKHNISISHLSEMIRDELGMSYSEYIISKRIQRAKELLADETLSVNEVGEAVGYKDYYYFTKVFKRVVGITPSKYRKNL